MNTLLTLKNISHKIGDKVILSAINLTLHEQEIVTIVGPNGAGKTTLLAIILGLVSATEGHIVRHTINGKALRLAYVPQIMNRDSTLPINVMEFLCLSKQHPGKAQVVQLLDELALEALKYALISDLSGGEIRRVLFARALLQGKPAQVINNPHYRSLFEQESENDKQLAELAFYRHSHHHSHDTH